MKLIEIKIFEVCRRCAGGIGHLFYQNLVKFLSILKMGKASEGDDASTIKGKLLFLKEFLKFVVAGLAHEEVKFFADFLITAYFECVYFVILKRVRPILEREDMKENWEFCRIIIKDLCLGLPTLFTQSYDKTNKMDILKKLP